MISSLRVSAPRPLRRHAVAITLAGLLVVASGVALAADEDDWTGSDSIRPQEKTWKIEANTGFEYQGETDLDSSGEFDYWMVSGGARLSRSLSEKVGVTISTDYRAIGYDFDDVVQRGTNNPVDPWGTVHVFRVMPIFSFALNESWSILAAPIGEFSGETSAQFGDAIRGGGATAVAWGREGLTIAVGVIALTEIEKDARIQPFVLFNWGITDGLSLGVRAENSRGGEVRLQYVIDRLSLGAGFGFRRELFRLNGDRGGIVGANPGIRRDGVGEEESAVARLTVGYRITDNVTIEGYGGVTIDGEFRLEDEDGIGLASSDYDDAGFGGVNFRFNF